MHGDAQCLGGGVQGMEMDPPIYPGELMRRLVLTALTSQPQAQAAQEGGDEDFEDPDLADLEDLGSEDEDDDNEADEAPRDPHVEAASAEVRAAAAGAMKSFETAAWGLWCAALSIPAVCVCWARIRPHSSCLTVPRLILQALQAPSEAPQGQKGPARRMTPGHGFQTV